MRLLLKFDRSYCGTVKPQCDYTDLHIENMAKMPMCRAFGLARTRTDCAPRCAGACAPARYRTPKGGKFSVMNQHIMVNSNMC